MRPCPRCITAITSAWCQSLHLTSRHVTSPTNKQTNNWYALNFSDILRPLEWQRSAWSSIRCRIVSIMHLIAVAEVRNRLNSVRSVEDLTVYAYNVTLRNDLLGLALHFELPSNWTRLTPWTTYMQWVYVSYRPTVQYRARRDFPSHFHDFRGDFFLIW